MLIGMTQEQCSESFEVLTFASQSQSIFHPFEMTFCVISYRADLSVP